MFPKYFPDSGTTLRIVCSHRADATETSVRGNGKPLSDEETMWWEFRTDHYQQIYEANVFVITAGGTRLFGAQLLIVACCCQMLLHSVVAMRSATAEFSAVLAGSHQVLPLHRLSGTTSRTALGFSLLEADHSS